MLWPVAEQDDTNIPGIDRLLALTDGVVAIALTLLVLQLQVPANTVVKNADSAADLWHALNIDGSELTSYLVSFLIIAQFWLVHHRAMRDMRGHSEGLAWRNFGFLLALTLMPFTSDLIGRYGSNPVAITLFALNLALISLASQWIVLYAASHDLVRGRAPVTARRARGRASAWRWCWPSSGSPSFWPGPWPRRPSTPGSCSCSRRRSRRASPGVERRGASRRRRRLRFGETPHRRRTSCAR